MGGKIFASAAAQGQPTLRTPRMTPDVYFMLRAVLQRKLQQCFPSSHVGTLIEAPEKESYGDLDFLVAGEDTSPWDVLAHQVGAHAFIPMSDRMTMAVPIDGQFSGCTDVRPIRYHQASTPSLEFSAAEYAQVDITLINPADFQWRRWYSSYSDLASILGFVVRKLGFVISDKGFLLRYELLDDAKDIKHFRVSNREGKLFLSSDPATVMRFLGLDPVAWENGFHTMRGLFAWLASCRLLTCEILETSKDLSEQHHASSLRQKGRTRTVFPDFVFRYCTTDIQLPALPPTDEDPVTRLRHRRAYLQDEAIKFFNVRAAFTHSFTAFHHSLVVQQADHLLKPILAELTGRQDKKLTALVRAFRRWTVVTSKNDTTTSQISISPVRLPDGTSQLHRLLRHDLEDFDEEWHHQLVEFVRENWEAIKQLDRPRT